MRFRKHQLCRKQRRKTELSLSEKRQKTFTQTKNDLMEHRTSKNWIQRQLGRTERPASTVLLRKSEIKTFWGLPLVRFRKHQLCSAGTTDKNRTSLLGKEDRKQCRLKIKTTTPTGLEHHQHLLPQEHNTPRSINIYFPSLAAWSARSSPGFAVPQIRVFRNRIGLCETDSQRKKSLPLP